MPVRAFNAASAPTVAEPRGRVNKPLDFDLESDNDLPPSTMRPSPLCHTLWTLHRNRSVARLCAGEPHGRGVLMCYSINDSVLMTMTLPDGPAILREAAALRFDLEARGWALNPPACCADPV